MWAVDNRLKATDQQEQSALLVKNTEILDERLFLVQCYGLIEIP
nr:MAG TPA: hypothetical protein [Caudoviricetes sp.]